MNARHKSILLDGCRQNMGFPSFDNIKVVGQNGQATYANACVLAFIVPWLSGALKIRVNRLLNLIFVKNIKRYTPRFWPGNIAAFWFESHNTIISL